MATGRRTRATDDFEAKEVNAPGAVIHREKQVSRFLALMMVMLFGLMAAGAVMGLAPDASWTLKVLPWPMLALAVYVGLTGPVVRTVVTTEEVRVVWGLRTVQIPVSSIKQCKVVSVPPPIQGHEKMAPHVAKEALTLEWVDGDKTRKHIIGAEVPQRLADSIQEARARAGGKRIAGPDDAETEAEAAAEAEAEAEAEIEAAAAEEVRHRG